MPRVDLAAMRRLGGNPDRINPLLPAELLIDHSILVDAFGARLQTCACAISWFAGKEYGSGSSRDWAAKGPRLLGVRPVIAQGYERIHRSNLVGMGVLTLQFRDGESPASPGLTGHETLAITGLGEAEPREATVTAVPEGGQPVRLAVRARLETPREWEYLKDAVILAGDIGGTNARLGLFDRSGVRLQAVATETYPSRQHASLEAFFAKGRMPPLLEGMAAERRVK